MVAILNGDNFEKGAPEKNPYLVSFYMFQLGSEEMILCNFF
jgi:hypothetical protein